METQPGSVNWSRINNPLYKGEARTMAWQAVAHGADGLLYWQWRSALGGQEQLHGTLVDQSGQPRLFYEEVKQIAEEFEKISPLLAGSTYPARAAMLNDYESRWSIQWQKHHKDFDYVAHLEHYYRTLTQANIPVDIISPDQSLKSYKLVIAPALVLFDEQRFKNIKEFIENGGYLVLTPRTALKNRDNAFLPERQPAMLSKLAGVEVVDYFAINEDIPLKGNWFTGISRTWAEILKIVDTSVTLMVAKYDEGTGWFDNQIAITVKAVRNGMVYYVGAYLDDGAQAALMSRIAQVAGITKLIDTPLGVTASRRTTPDKKEILILINHTRLEQTVNLASNTYDDHLTQMRHAGFIKLQPFGVAVLTKTI